MLGEIVKVLFLLRDLGPCLDVCKNVVRVDPALEALQGAGALVLALGLLDAALTDNFLQSIDVVFVDDF